MKITGKRVAQSAATTALVLGVSVFSSAHAQTVTKELSDAAETACRASATAKGFEVVDIVSVTPRAGSTDSVDVVLSLTRAGDPYKLTCGYTASAATAPAATAPAASPAPAAIASPSPAVSPAPTISPAPVQTPAAVTTPTPMATATPMAPVEAERGGISPWWWLLVPLIGIPLLWWLLRSKDETTTTTTYSEPAREAARTTTTAPSYLTPTDGVIRSSGSVINIYSGPGTTHQVTGTLHDGDRVRLSGRTDSTWVELADGGWIPRANVGTV